MTRQVPSYPQRNLFNRLVRPRCKLQPMPADTFRSGTSFRPSSFPDAKINHRRKPFWRLTHSCTRAILKFYRLTVTVFYIRSSNQILFMEYHFPECFVVRRKFLYKVCTYLSISFFLNILDSLNKGYWFFTQSYYFLFLLWYRIWDSLTSTTIIMFNQG